MHGTTKPSNDGLVRRHLDIDIRAVNQEERSVDVIASTETVDAHGEVVEQKFDLKRFKKNPIVLFNHNRFVDWIGSVRPTDLLPIGRAEGVKVEDGQLIAKIFFASAEANPMAEQVFRLVQEKVLRAVSIGFRPGKVTEEQDESGKTRLRLSKNELFEISVVPIPSNPDAVAKALEAEHDWLTARARTEDSAGDGGDIQTTETTMDLKVALETIEKLKAELAVITSERDKANVALADANKRLVSDATLLAKTEKDLEAANAQLQVLNGARAKSELDRLQCVKFAPAEREELESLVKDVGIDRVVKLLEKRANLAITERVTVEGKSIAAIPGQAPQPVEGGNVGASKALADLATEESAA